MNRETRTQLYIVAFALSAIVLGVAAARAWPIEPHTPQLWLIPLLVFLVALAGRYSILLSPQADASLFTVPMYMAVLLMHPAEAALVAVVGVLISQTLHRRPLRAVAFNMSMAGTAGGLAGVVFFTLTGGSPLALTQEHMTAAALAGLVLHVHNILPVVGMITIRKGWRFWLFWAQSYAIEAVVEGILLSMGLIAALLVVQASWAIVLMAPPAIAAYLVLKRTVEYAARKGLAAEELESQLVRELDLWKDLLSSGAPDDAPGEGQPAARGPRASLRSALR